MLLNAVLFLASAVATGAANSARLFIASRIAGGLAIGARQRVGPDVHIGSGSGAHAGPPGLTAANGHCVRAVQRLSEQ